MPILLLDLDFLNISQDETASLRNPETVVNISLQELSDHDVSAVTESCCFMLHEIISGLSNVLETLGCNIFDHIVETVNIELMD